MTKLRRLSRLSKGRVPVHFQSPTHPMSVLDRRLSSESCFPFFPLSIFRSDFATISQFYPDDSNKLQSFPIDPEKNCEATKFRILFGSSTDFFGRITIYTMELFGRWYLNLMIWNLLPTCDINNWFLFVGFRYDFFSGSFSTFLESSFLFEKIRP